jgi:putative membrane protein
LTEGEIPEPVDPRILFAAERTLFAYIRTGLALMGFGFVVARFGLFLRQLSLASDAKNVLPRQTGLSGGIGIALVVCGVLLCVYAPLWYHRTVDRLERGDPYVAPRFGLASAVALFVALIGTSLVVYLWLLGN